MSRTAVVVSNFISSWVDVPSGVPQGSLIGPLLFTIFVNDIEEYIKSARLLCFADDMKIFMSISSPMDVAALQSDLTRLEEYCAINFLDLNPSKCSIATYSRKPSVLNNNYTLKNHILQRRSLVRDLGVYHDSKLIFDSHVDAVVSRASKALGFVLRNSSSFKEIKTLKILYCTFVRSTVEYASQIWNPMYNTYINRIENIQKKFVRHLCYRLKRQYNSENYVSLAMEHHLVPLYKRRDVADVTYLLKIASGAVDCPELLGKLRFRAPSRSLRPNQFISLPPAFTNYRKNTYLWRASNSFNKTLKTVDIDLFNTSVAKAKRLLYES